jgi:hypothetical protein
VNLSSLLVKVDLNELELRGPFQLWRCIRGRRRRKNMDGAKSAVFE